MAGDQNYRDGGPAFPEAIAVGPAGDVYPGFAGMSLRDWFAGQAMPQFVQDDELRVAAKDKGLTTEQAVAKMAYLQADAMLAERAKGGA